MNLNEVSKDNAKVVFTWGSGTYAKTQENTFSGLTADGDGNYKLSVQVYAKQMTEMIHAELYDGTEKIAEKDYCVADYCRKVLNMPIEELTAVYNGNAAKAEKLVNLCKAMLIYGGTAQMQFGYRTDDLAYEGITYRADKALEYTLEDVGALGTTTFPEGFAEACGIEFWKSSLMLESETSYRMYFSVTDQTKLDNLTVKLGNETLSYTKSGSYIYYSISNIPAKMILSDYTLTFGDQTVTANAGEYIAKALDKGSDDLKETAKALYWYSTAAIEYFAN